MFKKRNLKKIKAAGLLVALTITTSLSIIGIMLIQSVDMSVKNSDNFNIKNITLQKTENKLNKNLYLWNLKPEEADLTSEYFSTPITLTDGTTGIFEFETLELLGDIQLNDEIGENIDITTTNQGFNKKTLYRMIVEGDFTEEDSNKKIKSQIEATVIQSFQ